MYNQYYIYIYIQTIRYINNTIYKRIYNVSALFELFFVKNIFSFKSIVSGLHYNKVALVE